MCNAVAADGYRCSQTTCLAQHHGISTRTMSCVRTRACLQQYCLACSVWHLSVDDLASRLAAQQFSHKILDVTLDKLHMCLAKQP